MTQGPGRPDLQVRDAIGGAEGAAGANRTEQTHFWTYFKTLSLLQMCSLCPCWRPNLYLRCLRLNLQTSLTSDLTDLKNRKVLISPSFCLRAHCLLSILRLVLVWRLVQLAERVMQMKRKRRSSHFFFIPSKTNTSVWRKTSVISWTGEWPLTSICRNKQLYMSSSISCCFYTQLSEI